MMPVNAMTMSDSPLARRRRREVVCTRFEAEWKTSQRPSVSNYLTSVPEGNRDELLRELLPIDEHYRRKLGEVSVADDYYPENSKQAEIIHEYFAAVQPTPVNARPNAPDSTDFPDLPGYTINSELGRGGMGVVYLARQHQPRRWVALKMLRDKIANDPVVLRRFHTEWDAVARLQHANILPVYAVGDVAGSPFMVVEYAVAGSLDRYIDGKPVTPIVAAHLVERLARGVAHAHANGVIHRDLKPGNVLLQVIDSRFQSEHGSLNGALPSTATPDPAYDLEPAWDLSLLVPKITDFGLAKLLNGEIDRPTCLERPLPANLDPALTSDQPANDSRPTMIGERLGTPSYMAPEQATGKNRTLGTSIDIYALGAIFYELLTGRPPFLGPTSQATLDQVLGSDLVRPRLLQPTVPRDLEVVCLKCLEKSPSQRYTTAADIADDLQRFQLGEPIKARQQSAIQRSIHWIRRHPTQMAIAVCLMFGIIGQSIGLLLLQAARQRAEVNLMQALEVSRTTMSLVNDDSEMTDRGLYSLRDSVITALIEKGESFLVQSPGNRPMQRELGRACAEKSQLRHRLSDAPGAQAAAARAIDLFETLVRTDAKSIDDRIELATCWNQFARQCAESSQNEDARNHAAKARRAIADVLGCAPSNTAALVAKAEHEFGQSEYDYGGERSDRLAMLKKASNTISEVIRTVPVHPRGARIAGEIWQRLATLTRGSLETDDVKQMHRDAMDRLCQLRANNPGRTDLDLQYGRALINISDGHLNCSEYEMAIVKATEGAAVFQSLIFRSPEDKSYKMARALSIGNRAQAFAGLGDITNADKDYAELISTLESQSPLESLVPLAKPLGPRKAVWDRLRIFHDYVLYLMYSERRERAIAVIDRVERCYPLTTTPGDPLANFMRADFMNDRARIFDLSGNYLDSKSAWERALQMDSNTHEHTTRAGWCAAAAGAGQTCEAIAAADALLTAKDLWPEDYYDLARAYARCCQHASLINERSRLIVATVNCLKQAQCRGYFSREHLIERRLDRVQDFDQLREANEYVTFINSLVRNNK
jgi:serine/threonine protein kinase